MPAELAALDPGIRGAVEWLRSHGFDTCDSGDGRHKVELGWPAEEVIPTPHVIVQCAPLRLVFEAVRLVGLLRRNGFTVTPCGQGGIEVGATYDPVDGSAVITVMGEALRDLTIAPETS